MDVLYLILVLLSVTRMSSVIAVRARLPAIVGELAAGIIVGFLLQTFRDSAPSLWAATQGDTFAGLASLGMFFLMLLAGIRMEPLAFVQDSRMAALVAIGGILVPVVSGYGLGMWFLPDSDFRFAQCLFLGTALAITAVPVTIRIFMDLDQLHSKVARTVIAAALLDDLLGLFLLAFLLGVIKNGGQLSPDVSILLLLGKTVLFFLVTIPVGLYVFPRVGRSMQYLKIPETHFSMLLIAALAYAVFAEMMGLHFIIGAFMAGMFFHPKVVDVEIYKRVEQQMSGITRGFLAPIFFVSVGFSLDLAAVYQVPLFVVMLILIAMLTKLVGAGLPALWKGYTWREATIVGVGMSGRGAVELIVAGVALRAGLFQQPSPPPPIVASLFSSVVMMAIVTTVLAPIVLRWLVRR